MIVTIDIRVEPTTLSEQARPMDIQETFRGVSRSDILERVNQLLTVMGVSHGER
jgi:hypothetical protein